MHTKLCDQLGIEFPIFAFTHCRDVVAAVSRAGGFGVLGAVGFSAEQLAIELDWIDDNVGDHPYGVDIVIPGKYEGIGEMDTDKLTQSLREMVPQGHIDFAKKILADHGVPELPEGETATGQLLGWTAATAAPQVECALKHEKVRLIANALGTPPEDVVQQVHDSVRLVAALCGSARQARKHADAGIDIIIAQGSEAGGHTGEIGSVVLWPEVIDAVAPIPVLAAGGIGSGRQLASALAMGAEGVWTGSIWLTVAESDMAPLVTEKLLAATSRDTVRSRSLTGKPARQLRTAWTDAWEREDSPGYLPMPLQFMLVSDAYGRINRSQDRDMIGAPVGQIVGQMNAVRPVRDVMFDLVDEYVTASERLARVTDA
jgi:NAD(P)H-dependent flavin oxidoreductase YrpB (nitropropane dioxygenase family)